jgi:hypothetical protein
MDQVSYIEGDVPILGLAHFVHADILREEPNNTISMLYEGGNKVLRLSYLTLVLYSCKQLTLKLDKMGDVGHSYMGPPQTRGRAYLEEARQTLPQQPKWDTSYGGDTS